MQKPLVEYAVEYAKRKGWRIHPCRPDKRPYLLAWQKNASSNESQIRKWWEQYPDAIIGCACGPKSGIWVIDADLPDGPDELERLNLPATLGAKTGSGGIHRFFTWNGYNIKNSSKRIAPGIDVRGDGGYVILPPSPHPDGGQYKWLDKSEIIHAPDWLCQKAEKPPQQEYTPISTGITTYGQSALTQEMTNMMAAPEGTRNQTLNNAALKLGSLVAGGQLDENTVKNALMSCAMTIGLQKNEASKTIHSGFQKGIQTPRKPNPGTMGTMGTAETTGDNRGQLGTHRDNGDKRDSGDKGDTGDRRGQLGTIGDREGTKGTDYVNSLGRFQSNLIDELRAYIKDNQGVFTNQDIDREFGLVDRQDKKNRSRALKKLELENLIKPDKRVSGKYHILTSEMEWIDLNDIENDYFDIDLPLDLHNMVNLPPRCVCVMAGTSNAGKTAFLLDIIKRNIQKKYDKLYLMSEMGPSEYRQRVVKMADNVKEWQKNVKSASISSGYDGPILHYNPDGLTVVDFLEEVEGEYYRITSDIRSIYDALNNGLVWVALQKHSMARVGRGGEGTTEKARLYLTIDTLLHRPSCTISYIRIVKAKDYPGENPNGKEIHVKITGGKHIERVSHWMYCNESQRNSYKRQYEEQLDKKEKINQ